MARKRMIDPNIWTDGGVQKLTDRQLLLFIGLISNADDEGIFEADSDSIYFRIARKDYKVRDIEVDLQTIASNKLIYLYGTYGFLPNWFKHQNLKGRKPQLTKYRRPPKKIVELFPEYISEWIATFLSRGDGNQYPFASCYTSESPV